MSVAPALVACDPYDLDSSNAGPTEYLYDSFGGGIRLLEVLFDRSTSSSSWLTTW